MADVGKAIVVVVVVVDRKAVNDRGGAASGCSCELNFMAICLACSRLAFMEAEERRSGLYFMKANAARRRLLASSFRRAAADAAAAAAAASLESREWLWRTRCGEDLNRAFMVVLLILCCVCVCVCVWSGVLEK